MSRKYITAGPRIGKTQARHVRSFGAYLLLLAPIIDDTPIYQRIRWCAPGDFTDWIGPGSGFLDLVDTPDPIMCGEPYGSSFIVYKSHSIITLNITPGSQTTFQVSFAYTKAGMSTFHGIVNIGDAHIFLGHDNFYKFEGSPHIEAVGDPIWALFNEKVEWFGLEQRAHAYHDLANGEAVFVVPVKEGLLYTESGWLMFRYNYKINTWSVYEYPVTNIYESCYFLGHGEFLLCDNKIITSSNVAVPGELLLDDSGVPIKSRWESKRFILEGEEDTQPKQMKRFLGLELESGLGAFTLLYNVDGRVKEVPIQIETLDGDTKVTPVHFNETGSGITLTFETEDTENRLRIQSFRLLFELGGRLSG